MKADEPWLWIRGSVARCTSPDCGRSPHWLARRPGNSNTMVFWNWRESVTYAFTFVDVAARSMVGGAK